MQEKGYLPDVVAFNPSIDATLTPWLFLIAFTALCATSFTARTRPTVLSSGRTLWKVWLRFSILALAFSLSRYTHVELTWPIDSCCLDYGQRIQRVMHDNLEQ
jgi:hypothetical protein